MRILILNSDSFFLNKTADLMSDVHDVTLVQNYTPSLWMVKLLSIIDSMFNTRLKRLKTRRCKSSKVKIHGLLINDLLKLFSKIAKRLGIPNDRAEALVAKNFGSMASKYLGDAKILHLRTGYGQGGIIEKAKENGIKIIADHSIACTEEIDDILSPEYKKYGINVGIGPKSEFWKLVILDCKEADLIIANSDYVKSSFIRHGYDAHKIIVNYLGVREDWFSIKTDYTLKNGLLKILFIGEFGVRKGAEYLIKASQILNNKGINYKIIVIGKQAEIDNLIRNTDMSHFEFVGTVLYEELKNYYIQSDVYLFPSLCEGSTRAGMEAMAAGLPVILTENCGCPVQDGRNGLIVPIKDEKAIANAVERIYYSENLRESLGKEAARTIANNYTWEHYKNNLLTIYESLGKY